MVLRCLDRIASQILIWDPFALEWHSRINDDWVSKFFTNLD